MDYLKNIVLQYMSFPPSSPERNSLVPVLALLLQFTPAELKATQNASHVPLWSSRTIKEVKIPAKIGIKTENIEDKNSTRDNNNNNNNNQSEINISKGNTPTTISTSSLSPISSTPTTSTTPTTYLQYNEV